MNMSKCNFRTLMLALGVAGLVVGCTSIADGDPVELHPGTVNPKSSNSEKPSSSESKDPSEIVDDEKLESMVEFVEIPAAKITYKSVVYSVSSFDIATTEVTQALYEKVMGEVPTMGRMGDSIAVANVSWYDAVLFCNALAKMVGLDTAYIYDEVGEFNFLKNVAIDYSVESVRLPTVMEWGAALGVKSTDMYYWGSQEASKYAYYGQTKGPVKVASYLPNDFGLYDMGGNVAEWTNDWFGPYSAANRENPTGESFGNYKVIRGGSWSEPAKAMASNVDLDKREPSARSQMIGFRIVHSVGF